MIRLFESLGHVCAMRKERKVIFLFSTFFVLDVTISFVICLCFLYLDEKAFVFSFVKKHILSKNKRDFRTFLSTYISLVPRDNPWSRDTNKPCFRTPIFRYGFLKEFCKFTLPLRINIPIKVASFFVD